MNHTYQISGMTCSGCSAKVKGLLEKVPGVTAVNIDLEAGNANLSMSHHIATPDLQNALAAYPKYQLTENRLAPLKIAMPAAEMEETRSFWAVYKPVLLVFAYISGASLLVEITSIDGFDGMRWMRHFMAGFFLVFSFFKMLDVPAFAAAYSGYDEVAKRWSGWGYIYPFVELGLGILFLISFNPLWTNTLTLAVMGVSTIGVVRSLLAKRQFQCACLGAVFNLPMSKLTLFEDLLMVAMSAAMLIMLSF